MSDKDKKNSECKCPYCDAELDEDSILCGACNVRIIFCQKCGKPVASNAKKCPNCGAII